MMMIQIKPVIMFCCIYFYDTYSVRILLGPSYRGKTNPEKLKNVFKVSQLILRKAEFRSV